MTTDRDGNPHSSSPTAHVLTELQLYGWRPFQDEPDPRPLPEARVIGGAVADMFDALIATLCDTRLEPDLDVSPLKLEKVAQADRRREADLRGALKNPDTTAPGAPKGGAPNAAPGTSPGGATAPAKEPSATTQPPKGEQPSVASGDIGTTSDEQLSEAVDVLRGLALVSGRTASR